MSTGVGFLWQSHTHRNRHITVPYLSLSPRFTTDFKSLFESQIGTKLEVATSTLGRTDIINKRWVQHYISLWECICECYFSDAIKSVRSRVTYVYNSRLISYQTRHSGCSGNLKCETCERVLVCLSYNLVQIKSSKYFRIPTKIITTWFSLFRSKLLQHMKEIDMKENMKENLSQNDSSFFYYCLVNL